MSEIGPTPRSRSTVADRLGKFALMLADESLQKHIDVVWPCKQTVPEFAPMRLGNVGDVYDLLSPLLCLMGGRTVWKERDYLSYDRCGLACAHMFERFDRGVGVPPALLSQPSTPPRIVSTFSRAIKCTVRTA